MGFAMIINQQYFIVLIMFKEGFDGFSLLAATRSHCYNNNKDALNSQTCGALLSKTTIFFSLLILVLLLMLLRWRRMRPSWWRSKRPKFFFLYFVLLFLLLLLLLLLLLIVNVWFCLCLFVSSILKRSEASSSKRTQSENPIT